MWEGFLDHFFLSLCYQAHQLLCLNDFVEAQTTYYAQCYQYMVDLQKQLGRYNSTVLILPLYHEVYSMEQ